MHAQYFALTLIKLNLSTLPIDSTFLFQDSLSKRDLCVLLTACICHDLDHPGFNNTYQINAKTELAIR